MNSDIRLTMNRHRKFIFMLLPVLVIAWPFSLKAGYTWTPGCTAAWEQVFRLNFKEAETLIRQEKVRKPDNLIPYYIESQADFLRCFIHEDKAMLETLKKGNAMRLELFEESKDVSPYRRYCLAEMYLQLTVARIRFREFLGAAYDVRKCYRLLEENQRIYPEFKPNLRGLGLIHAVVGAIPKNYQWMAGVLGLKGSIKQGLDELRQVYTASQQNNELIFLRDETVVILSFLELNLGKEKDLQPIRRRFWQMKDLQNKPLLLFAKSTFHFAAAENDSIIALLSHRATSPSTLPYLSYMEGNAYLHDLNPRSIVCYQEYLKHYKGTTYRASSLQRIAWSYLLQENIPEYKKYMAMIPRQTDNEQADEDKSAIREASEQSTPNITLLKARLLFDGGYYQRALAELAARPISEFPGLKDKIEFTYRFARIMDKTGNNEKALEYYQLTLKNGYSQPWYYAANSALLIAQYYEEKGNRNKAIEYYKTTLSMRNHEFQNSIDQKAKAGLNRLGE